MQQLSMPLQRARAEGERLAEVCAKNAAAIADWDAEAAGEFILGYLRAHGKTSGEQLTAKAMAHGHVPHDARAFGHVFQRLSQAELIVCIRSDLPRERGHGTTGGKLWRAVK